MKRLNYFLIALTILSTNAFSQDALSEQKEYFDARQNPSKWDMEMLTVDLEDDGLEEPINYGAFPVGKYDTSSNFKGLGNMMYPGVQGYYKSIDDKKILYNSFFINKNDLNAQELGAQDADVFFQIVVLTDFIDEEGFSHLGSEIVSRNHPDYVGQGFFKTQQSRIDYVAFKTATDDAYALVNMRLFDLNRGNVILIAPQKDGSFRSMQIESGAISTSEIDSNTDQILLKEEVQSFFRAEGNI